MRRIGYVLLFGFIAVADICAQQESATEGTRQLYYLAKPSNDKLPPLPHGAPPSAANVATPHLGIRYNLVLVGPSGKTQQIASDKVLKEGDCFAIELQANRTGYLYVLAKQSSGAWTPLMDMPGQRDPLPSNKTVRIPAGACFDIHNPPGTETLFVVVSRDPHDFFELYANMKEKETPKLSASVQHLDEKFGGTRDITIAKVSEPQTEDEPRGAVYVVNKKASASIVTRIEVRHR
jgi:hypothetical protein